MTNMTLYTFFYKKVTQRVRAKIFGIIQPLRNAFGRNGGVCKMLRRALHEIWGGRDNFHGAVT